MEIPDAGDMAYLLEMLFEAGPTVATPMGDTPLGWSDLRAYAEMTGTDLDPWEARTLREMSAAYLAERENGKHLLSIPPVRKDET
jgi:hypothetical protein